MEIKKTIKKLDEWLYNYYLSQGLTSVMFCQEHVNVLNDKLRPYNIWINRKTPQGDSICETWYAVEKLKPVVQATGWRKAIQFLSNPIEQTLFETSDTKKLQNYLYANFSKELGFDTSKPAQPVRSELPIPIYQPKPQVATKTLKKGFERDM